MLTQKEAIKKIADMGSHVIVSPDFAAAVGEPFGLQFETEHFEPDGDPKGPMNVCDGVDIHWIASSIADKLGLVRRSYFGRGKQFWANIEVIQKTIGN